MSQARCFHCKEDVVVQDEVKSYTSNQRLRVSGVCPKCSSKLSRFVPDPDKPALSPEAKKAREQERREQRKKDAPAVASLPIAKRSKKRRIVIEGIQIDIVAQEVSQEGTPVKKRKLTAKEKREKEIADKAKQI